MVDPIDLHVGRRLRGRRLTIRMSQELGKTVGVTFQQIQKYENGKNRISGSRMAKMASALGIEPSYFFEGAPGIGGKGNGGAEEAAWLAEPLANKTLKAFVRIKSRSVRQAVLHLVRALDGK